MRARFDQFSREQYLNLPERNRMVDDILNIILNAFGTLDALIFVGSFAKKFPEKNLAIKDVDIEVKNDEVFEFVKHLHRYTNYRVIYDKYSERVIVSSPFYLVEFWNNKDVTNFKKTGKIKIKDYARRIEFK